MSNKLTPLLWKAVPFLALLCLFLTNGCKKDLLQPNSKGIGNALSFAEAKQYFEANLKQLALPKKLMSSQGTGNTSQKITIQDLLYNKQPVWDKAYQKLISTGTAVKIPLDFGNVRKVVDKHTKAYVPYSSLNYLFMYKDSLQRIHAEWVYLKPTLNWLNGNRASFEGSIEIKDWNGKLLKTYNFGTAKAGQLSRLSAVKGTLMGGGDVTPIPDGCLIWAVQAKCSCDWAWSSGTRKVGSWNPDKCDYCDLCVDYFCMPEPLCETCPPPPDWGGGSGGGGNNGSGSGYTPGGGDSGGGGTGPGDYEPEDCTNEEAVVNPDGSTSPPPCVPVPTCETCLPPQDPPGPSSAPNAGQALINILNADGELEISKVGYLQNPDNDIITKAMFRYLSVNKNNAYNREFLRWAIGYLIENPSFDYNSFFAPDEFDGINNLPSTPPAEELLIDYGIRIEDVPTGTPSGVPRLIGSTQNRNNTEDMQYGTNGNVSGIILSRVQASDDLLFTDMGVLFLNCTTLSPTTLRTVGLEMINRFKSSTGGTYENPILNLKVEESVQFKNYIGQFGRTLSQRLKAVGANINNVSKIDLDSRPVFNGFHNKFAGLQILINDTEYTEIKLLNFQINPATLEWVADVDVVIYDHFGLDKHDALAYQDAHSGFASWWLLQHTRGYKPFETKVTVRKRLYGQVPD